MPFRFADVPNQRVALETIAKLIAKGCVDPTIVRAARKITSDCPARDDLCELEAIYRAVKEGDPRVPALAKGLRYVADPRSVDWYQGAKKMVEECEDGACAGDCLPVDTLVLRRDYRLVPLSELRVGDEIMGDGVWTRVLNIWDKGILSMLDFTLNNGSILRCTADHRVFRVPRVPAGNLSGERGSAEETLAGDLRVGDDLLTIAAIPFGDTEIDPDLAWLLGVFIADGWIGYSEKDGRPVRASISGKDGHPKEAQKRRVVEIAQRFGWKTRWHERYVEITDEDVASRLAEAGRRAPQKHVPKHLNLDRPSVEALISGLLADAHVGYAGPGSGASTVHGTTSDLMAIQLRVLYRMLGRSTHVRRVVKHGGLGKNPIWRITPRVGADGRSDGKRAKLHARVKSISAAPVEIPAIDIQTESGRFYLPESDTIVHNCDEHTILVGSLCGAIGFRVGARAYGKPRTKNFQHVYCVAAVPKNGPWPARYGGHGMDTTVPDAYVGWEPTEGHNDTRWVVEE